MNTMALDEDSIQVQINLIDIKKNKANESLNLNRDNLLNRTKKYSKKTIKEKVLIVRYALENFFERTFKGIGSVKSYLQTKIFLGRGSLYRYIAVFSILLPLVVSIFILRSTSIPQNVKTKNLAITKATIDQATNSPNTIAIEGKLIENQAPASDQAIVSWYKVQNGDTLASIAKKYNVSTDTIVWSNNLTSDNLTTGELLNIVPVQGIIHTVENGESLNSIATAYDTDPTQIAAWNLIDTTKPLTYGQKILIPGSFNQEDTTVINANLPGIAAGASAGCPLDDTWCYLQTDPRWASIVLGTQGQRNPYSYYNIKTIGCLITDVAMISQYYYPGKGITPATVAYSPSNFVGGGLFTLSGLGLFNVAPIGGIYGSVDWSQIDSQIAAGHPVIVGIGYNYHYVVLYQKVNGHYIMNDPAFGGALVFDKYYHQYSITQAFLYTPIK